MSYVITIFSYLMPLFAALQSSNSYGQMNEVDSLEKKLETVGRVEKNRTLRRLIDLYQYSNMDKSIQYIDEAISISYVDVDSSALMRLIRNKIQILSRQGKFHLAKALLQIWLPRCKNNVREFGHMLSLMGYAETMQGNYGNALRYYIDAIGLPSTPGGVFKSSLLNNVGLVYYKLKDYKKANYYFSKANSRLLVVSNLSDESNRYFNLGRVYCEMGYLETAECLTRVGLEMCSFDNRSFQMVGHHALAMVMWRKGDLKASDSLFRITLKTANENADSRFIAECSLGLAQIQLAQSRIAQADFLLQRCEFECLHYGYKEILFDCYKEMVVVAKALGDVIRVEKYQTAIIELGLVLHGREVMNNLTAFELDFRTIQNEKIIRSQQERVKALDAITQAQNKLYFVMLVFGFSLLLFVILSYRAYSIKNTIYKRLVLIERERNNKLAELRSDVLVDDQLQGLIDKLRFFSARLLTIDSEEFGGRLKSTRNKIDNLIEQLLEARSNDVD